MNGYVCATRATSMREFIGEMHDSELRAAESKEQAPYEVSRSQR
jgi:hypothetical protein